MVRAVASVLLTVLMGGPVAASACQERCVDAGHGSAVATADTRAPEPTPVPEHQHHHEPAAREPSSAERVVSTSTAPAETAVRATHDCCLDQSGVEPAAVSPGRPHAETTAEAVALSWAMAGVLPVSTMRPVAHALEPPADPPRLSSVLRI